MLPFRTEIRNTPQEQTVKVFIAETACDKECRDLLQTIEGVREVEIRETIDRNRVEENLTVYRKEGVDINNLKKLIEYTLDQHFAYS
ncbi:hypothetical protein N9901_01775 [Flavobacteriaceae bacterium]|nr:hypothetical protein [Flavobacteriaceae bacterium]